MMRYDLEEDASGARLVEYPRYGELVKADDVAEFIQAVRDRIDRQWVAHSAAHSRMAEPQEIDAANNAFIEADDKMRKMMDDFLSEAAPKWIPRAR